MFLGSTTGGAALLAGGLPAAQATRDGISAVAVGHETREDDMPAIAAAPDGSVWVAWLSLDGARDDVALRHFKDNQWQNIQWVPATSGDSWLAQIAADAENRVWVVWSQQVEGVWDIYARQFDPARQRWDSLQRLSSAGRLPDIYPRLWSDGQGRAVVAWQGFRGRGGSAIARSNIFVSILEGGKWSEEIRVTDRDANDWEPAAAIDQTGTVWVAYDSYKNGNYDVFLRQVRGGRPEGEEIAVAASPRFEARATLAIDSLNRVWVAWEEGPENWGKDQGQIVNKRRTGNVLGDTREPCIACFEGGRRLEPPTTLGSVFKEAPTRNSHVFSDGQGSVWVVAMMMHSGPPMRPVSGKRAYWDYWRKAPFHYFEYWVTHLDGDRWRQPFALPNSKGRCSTRMSAALGPGHQLLLAWPTDNRKESCYHRPIRQQVYAGSLSATASVPARLVPAAAPAEQAQPSRAALAEAAYVRVMRDYSASAGGKQQRLLRGDLHRHTELSWDGGGFKDGSPQDMYRYMFDAAALDFGADTDHQGGLWPYWRWFSAKMADMHHVPGAYTSLFGYERSASFPHGHRNVFFAERRQARVTPFFLEDGVSLYSFPLTAEGDEPADETPQLVENDTALLLEEVRAHGGIAIPHTTGTGMGTDWRYHDDELEPVVEIFQGCRQSYEDIGALYCATAEQIAVDEATPPKPSADKLEALLLAMFRRRPQGMVASAWRKGHRLGVIASSDHTSTHISYAMVYTDDPTRAGIIAAIRKRRTYGATDNIILDVRMGNHLMGDSFPLVRAEPLRITARGTASIARIDILRDSSVIQSFEPGRERVELEFQDPRFDGGKHYYYVRLMQTDGMIAWSSPLFVNYNLA